MSALVSTRSLRSLLNQRRATLSRPLLDLRRAALSRRLLDLRRLMMCRPLVEQGRQARVETKAAERELP